jgi:hypothetical protein
VAHDAAQPAAVPAWGAAQLAAAAAPFERRGFVNSGNLCFANATLQALLAGPARDSLTKLDLGHVRAPRSAAAAAAAAVPVNSPREPPAPRSLRLS